jgi:hypothetical protein
MSAGLLLLGGLIAIPLAIRIIWAVERRLFPRRRNMGPFGESFSHPNRVDTYTEEGQYVISSER